jgi:formyltetrahydrofolate-dependent phosphoribosylglycinamide formyltransferase
MANSPINLAVLVSGSGTTLQNLINRVAARELNAKISIVIGSREGLLGIERARKANLPCCAINRKSFPDVASFSRAVFDGIDEANVDLVCLAGWLCFLDLPPKYHNRVINIHPSLLPSFGGKGMYGAKVHQAVIDHGCKVSGCTVHVVDSVYDSGPIILQRTCPVLDDDSAETLAHRVFEEEKIAYPQAIQLFAENRLKIEGRRVRITSRA